MTENGKALRFFIEMKHGLGDCVRIIPALKILRDAFPDAYIALAVNGKVNEDLLKLSGIRIDKFYYLSLRNNPLGDTIKLFYKLRKEHIDYAIAATMTPAKKAKLLFHLIGAEIHIGEQFSNDEGKGGQKHIVERNIDLLRGLVDIPARIPAPFLYPDQVTVDEIRKNMRSVDPQMKRLIVNIGGGLPCFFKVHGKKIKEYPKDWGMTKFKQLITLLVGDGYQLFLLGGEDETDRISYVRELIDDNKVMDFVGKLSIKQSVALSSICDVSIGVDTGMQHVADAVGTKTVSIFGLANPKLYGAYSNRATFIEYPVKCQYCFTNDQYKWCDNRICLKGITVEVVHKKILEVLGNNSYNQNETGERQCHE